MSTNPIDQNTTPKPTGSLEELFRHHLGEEAAVPPRPMLWDQIDNSLLIRQNEIYRRRLAATRWVAAASLLLASLAGTGWWVGRDAMLSSRGVATVGNPTVAPRTDADAAAASTNAGRRATAANSSLATTTAAIGANQTTETRNIPTAPNASSAREAVAATAAGRAAGFGSVSAAQSVAGRYTPAARYGGSRRFQTPAAASAAFAARTNPGTLTPVAADGAMGSDKEIAAVVATSATSGSVAATAAAAGGAAGSGATATGVAATAPSLLSPASTASAMASSMAAEPTGLAARSASLALAEAETLPAGLATVSVPTEVPAPIDAHRWHYSTSYMAGAFNPNINFSRKGIEPEHDYDPNPAFGTNSPALTEQAATEYRDNLRPGFSQRLAVLATRHLKGHWSLSTGIELNQATARSASSSAFVGEQLFDLGQAARPLQTTDFRYRLASVPVEVRYTNPVKRGWSLYGRLGGVVSALLGVRSEVAGNPEATRTYSIASAGTPYRRVLASVRGGAGAQFRAGTGKWALSAGPVADLGLVSLNAHPAQSYLAQSHPYTIGVEAAIEFGR